MMLHTVHLTVCLLFEQDLCIKAQEAVAWPSCPAVTRLFGIYLTVDELLLCWQRHRAVRWSWQTVA